MSNPGPWVFLERRSYRRRRLLDAARVLPLLGAALFMVPLLWPRPDPAAAPGAPDPLPMSTAVIYVFGVWAGLIVLGAVISHLAIDVPRQDGEDD